MDYNKKCITTPDKIILQGKTEDKETNKQCRRRRKHLCKRKRIDTTSTKQKFATQQKKRDCCTDNHISQQIHVERQQLQYIINLNTTVCDHKSKHRKKHDRKDRLKQSRLHEIDQTKHSHSNCYIEKKDSIVPMCFRQVCVNTKYKINRRHQEILRRRNAKRYQHSKERVSSEDEAKHTNGKEKRKKRLHHHKCKHSRQKYIQKNCKLFSSVSSTSLNDDNDNLTYEDISSSSLEFDTDIEKRTFCKRIRHHKHCNHVKSKKHYGEEVQESKLDTLIRRTKERERKLVEQSRSNRKPKYTSTPIHKRLSSSVSCSDMDISFNSRSTLVLETRSFAYSPSESCFEDLHQSSETEKLSHRGYSPSSPTKNKDYKLIFSETNHHKLVNIKNEPTMDIEAYSPTHSPYDFSSTSCDIPNVPVKKENIKSEPLFSPELSPIHFEEDNCGLQFCKIESVKSERDNY